jgi:hypothetical protein
MRPTSQALCQGYIAEKSMVLALTRCRIAPFIGVLPTKLCAAQYYCSALHNCFAKCDANVQTPARLQLRLGQDAIPFTRLACHY